LLFHWISENTLQENNKKYIMLHTGPPFWYDGPFFIYTAAK
jgi:hypothetical protein